MLLRRPPPADPAVQRRLAAVLPRPEGWVPGPRGGVEHAAGTTAPRGEAAGGGAAGPAPGDLVGDLIGDPVGDLAGHEPGGSADDPRTAGTDGTAAAPATGSRHGAARASALDAWRSARLDPGRRGLLVLLVVALLAAALAAVVVLRGRPSPVAVPEVVRAGVPVPGAPGSGAPSPGGEVVVAVGGRVAHPGLLRLPPGSRVDDAVRAAGGAAPDADLTGLNLARRLVDGEQVLVGVPAPAAAPGAAAPALGGGLVDLNAATAAQLDDLPGVGPVLAQRIVDWRTEHGRFGSVDQLREVDGIGESKYAQLKSKVAV